MGQSVSSWRRLTMAVFLATPPVKVISGSMPTRLSRLTERLGIATWAPLGAASTLPPGGGPAEDLRFGEHGARRRHLDRVFRGQRERAQIAEGDVECGRGGAEEPAGAGGAFVVHAEGG